jgi:arginine/serine-rich splicing factor 4/5/6
MIPSTFQDLKDMMRGAGEPTYADAHKKTPNEGFISIFKQNSFLRIIAFRIVCFASREDMRRALDKYQGKEINGRKIKLIEDCGETGGRRGRRYIFYFLAIFDKK